METSLATIGRESTGNGLITTIKKSKALKSFVHFLLIPRGQARPRWFTKVFVNRMFHKKHSSAQICRTARMDVFPFQPFTIGKKSTIEDYAVVNNGVGPVEIGSGVRVGIGDVLMGPVKIGDNTIIGQHCLITGLDHNYQNIDVPIKDQGVSRRQTSIGKDCFIGANVSILPGVTIGDHCVVAAGSVVTKSVGDYYVVAGNPAKPVKKYDSELKSWVKP
jgi:acetyltransferase-like isoleucine patch superfamily enzyme